jgi:predicted ArsR family transcriptional regulator
VGERVLLANCPFHALAQAQTELVCHMNEAMVAGIADTLQPHCPRVTLDPEPGRCCVVLEAGAS